MSLFRNETGELKTGLILVITLIGVIAVWAITFIVLFYMEKPGEIGDSFGMVNALFSALAFSLLIYTSLLQTQELRLQREELRENRKQLESSAKAHNELVRLNKIIHADKILPQYQIENFIETETEIKFYLKVLFDDIEFNTIKAMTKSNFGYGHPTGSVEGLKSEGDFIGPITIQKSIVKDIIQPEVLYSTSDRKEFKQEIYNIDSNWVLGPPHKINSKPVVV